MRLFLLNPKLWGGSDDLIFLQKMRSLDAENPGLKCI
jgi:hypothetical protein